MRNYEAVLKRVKAKIDRRMEKNDPASYNYEMGIADKDGNYAKDACSFDEWTGWTRSFLTGAVAYMYYHYKEEKYLDYLKKELSAYRRYLRENRHHFFHDIGFLFALCPGALYELTGDEEAYELNMEAANEFVKGFVPTVGMFNGFGDIGDEFVNPIIDDMMNITLMMWAWRKTKHPTFYSLFDSHIRVVRQYMMREDFTYRHSYLFDSVSGRPVGECNYCGNAPGSVWSRGQMWALYSVVSVLKATDEKKKYAGLLGGQLLALLDMMGDDKVPLWDFRCLTEETKSRDSSAAAVFAAALLKINQINDADKIPFAGRAKDYMHIGEEVLDELIDKYMLGDDSDACLDKGQAGKDQLGCVWGDYFFVEALMRRVHGKDCPDFFIGKEN